MWRIARADPEAADLDELFARHTADMHAETPPESIHILPRASLKAPGIAFYVVRGTDGTPVGMGAVKRLSPDHGEIKSMHVLQEMRGKGVSRQLLERMIADARAEGIGHLSLETGVEPIFAAARNLYARTGFMECAPFGGYSPDPNSIFMTRRL